MMFSATLSPKTKEVLNDVQARFEVKVEELPTTIDKSTYMNNWLNSKSRVDEADNQR